LAEYRAAWLPSDAIAGVTLAAYAIPVSLAYAGLAGLPPQAGIYGYLLGGSATLCLEPYHGAHPERSSPLIKAKRRGRVASGNGGLDGKH